MFKTVFNARFLSPTVMGSLCVVLSAVLFSTKSIFVKMAYGYHIDATLLLLLRMLFALPFFVLMLLASPTPKKPLTTQNYIGLWLAGVVGYYGASILDFWGMEFISASLERLILFMYPTLTVFLAALFFKTPITQKTAMAIGISYLGMMLVFGGNQHEESAHLVLGSVLVFGGALAYAGYLVGSGFLIARFGAARFTALALMIATLCSIIHYAATHSFAKLLQLPMQVWLLSAVLGFFCTFLPATLLTQGIRRIGAPQAALISGISPVITLALGAWLLNDKLTLWQFMGAGLILVGVMFISYRPVSSEQLD